MEVSIDGKPFPVTLPPGATVRQALDGVREELVRSRRLAVKFVLDGVLVEQPSDDKRLDEPADGHARLEISTEDPETICTQVVRGLIPFVESLKELHRRSAEVLHQGHLQEAMEGVKACVQGWEVLVRGMRHVGSVLELSPIKSMYDGTEVKRNVAELEKALREFKKAFDAQDLVRVADLVEYDLASRLPAWEQTLTTMLHRLEGGGNGGAATP